MTSIQVVLKFIVNVYVAAKCLPNRTTVVVTMSVSKKEKALWSGAASIVIIGVLAWYGWQGVFTPSDPDLSQPPGGEEPGGER